MTKAKAKAQPKEEQPKDEQEEVEFDLGWPPDAEFVDPPPPEK